MSCAVILAWICIRETFVQGIAEIVDNSTIPLKKRMEFNLKAETKEINN